MKNKLSNCLAVITQALTRLRHKRVKTRQDRRSNNDCNSILQVRYHDTDNDLNKISPHEVLKVWCMLNR